MNVVSPREHIWILRTILNVGFKLYRLFFFSFNKASNSVKLHVFTAKFVSSSA